MEWVGKLGMINRIIAASKYLSCLIGTISIYVCGLCFIFRNGKVFVKFIHFDMVYIKCLNCFKCYILCRELLSVTLSTHPFLSLLFFCFVCPLINKFKLSLAFQCRSKTNRKSDKKAKPKQNLDPSLFTTHHGDQSVPSPHPSLPPSRSKVEGMNKFSLIMLAQPSQNVHTCDDRPYSLLSFKYLYVYDVGLYRHSHTEREREG